MPFPEFPNLPDDQPMIALALFTTWLRECWEFLSRSKKHLLLLAISAGSVIGLCLRLWTDTALPLVADAVPMLVAIAGVVMSYKQPKRESHFMTTFVLFAVGIVGTGIMSWARIRTERLHKREVQNLTDKMDVVKGQNTQILLSLNSAKSTGQMTELERRENIQKSLRNEYILSHSQISPGLLNGTEFPPSDWMNKRLAELGEKWTVATSAPSVAVAPPPRSFVIFDAPRFGVKRDDKGQPLPDQDMKAGEGFGFNVYFKQDGPNPVDLTGTWFRLYYETDVEDSTIERVVGDFEKFIQDNPPRPPGRTRTLQRGEVVFNTAFLLDDSNNGRLVTQADLDALHGGTRVAFVLSQIDYKDGNRTHHARLCYWLQPPARYPGVWHGCGSEFGKSD